jgi:chorismate--pyruvate lyase
MQYPIWELNASLNASEALLPFLRERGSFTQKMIEAAGHPCRVDIKDQRWQAPWEDERAGLELPEDECAWVREVLLVFGEPCIFARSIFPKKLIESDARFQELEGKALGSVLFNDPACVRGEVEVAELKPGHALYEKANACLSETPGTLWARRSLFYLNNHQLLVCEVLFPHVATL